MDDVKDAHKQQFLHPSNDFTPVPFWFWNDALNEAEIVRQIVDFHKKGINAFVIHPRIGIPEDIPYMGERFLSLVAFAVSEAEKLRMRVVLYDEGMYPSGSAHGMVVARNAEWASRGLRRETDRAKINSTDKIIYEDKA